MSAPVSASSCGDGNAPAGGVCATGPFNPVDNDAKVGATTVNGGDTVTLSGINQFVAGKTGATGSQPLQDFAIVSGSENLATPVLAKGAQNGTASYTDPITGSARTINVYVNGQMSAPEFGATNRTLYVGVDDNQYIDARIGSVESSGGTLNIASTGNFTIAAKQTTLYSADGTGAADSNLSWQTPGNTTIVMNGATLPSNPVPGNDTVTSSALAGWPTTVTVNGTGYTITSLADYQAFNTTLIGLIETGEIDQAQYDAYMTQAANLQTGSVRYTAADPLPAPTDDVWQSVGTRTVLAANGARASAEIQPGSTLTVTGANGGVLRGTNGASLSNAGTIVSNDGVSVYLRTGSSGTNTGVITAKSSATAVIVDGSTFTNQNIINKGVGANSSAITANNATVVNNGIINLGTAANSANTSAYGVNITGGTFTNSADAVIYIGRSEQTGPNGPAADVALNLGGNLAAINVGSGATVNNEGAIVIGTKTQGAAGIRVDGTTNVQVDNSGSITVKGAAADVPRLNTGLYVRNSGAGSSIDNSGAIVVEGVNGIGIQVIADGAGKAANATSTGSITVAGGADPASGTRNFGVWAEGADRGSATTTISGPVTLTGIGAIGVHARGTTDVTVEDTATVDFASGTDQIGYFIYGPDAKIAVLRNTLEVNTERSTLFRVADGATFDGSGYTITVSGEDSVGVLGTGAGTKIETKGSTFYLTGEGSNAVTIEGGATGNIDDATRIFLNAAGTVAGIADGQKHDIYGNPVDDPNASTKFTNNASLTSAQTGVTGLIARNKATVENAGEVTFSGAGSIGLLAETGGQVLNTAKVTVSGADSFGLVAQNEGSQVTNSGAAHVEGANGIGLLAHDKAKVINDAAGIVTVTGQGGIGLAARTFSILENNAQVNANADGTTSIESSGRASVTNTGNVVLNGINSTGLRADDGNISNSGDVTSTRAGNIGLFALNGGNITTTGDVLLSGAGSIGLHGENGGRIEATGSKIDITGWAVDATNGAFTFILSGVTATGTSGLLSATDGGQTVVSATGSELWGRAYTAAGSTSALTLTGSQWTLPADSNVTDLLNDGSRIVFVSPASGGFKTLTVDNDYAGANGGTLVMSSTLNSGVVQLTDKLVVHDDTAGHTVLDISNYNGLGAYTPGDGIEVVQVDGASSGTFALAQDLYAGAFQYDLFKGGRADPNDGDWYLRSALSTGAQTVVPYAESLLKFGQLTIGTLQQRTGNRLWLEEMPASSGLVSKAPVKAVAQAQGADVVGGGVWGRILGLIGSISAKDGVGYDQDLWFAQAGVDGVLHEDRNGALVLGIMGTYGAQSVDVGVSPHPILLVPRQGKIDTSAYGLGGSLTWIGTDGLYVDGVSQMTWYDSDLSASGFPALANGNKGLGYALSFETGRCFALSGGWTVVPQAQLIYSSVSFDDFFYFNPNGSAVGVSGGGGESLLGRAGVRLENLSRNAANGRRLQGYGIVNLTYEFLNGASVNVGYTPQTQDIERLWGEVGLGGTWALNDRFSLYGEGLYSTALNDFGDSYTVRGTLGLRYTW
ncbi:autotransporter outer membrane beta-barrel domain-containing protein [Xanthobacter autotrophicus]|uniref:autotransporter outer membrane beta-barrel domain-containing protein n=1 Tax=Xanthobacter autotrophicus TaxID=280 RepID=UPI0024A773FC|nr:autotransporter outer membrane beta-barrel domain-containing protein [Xanthobacter autotrophicus]MDI4658331.1 autotransporter outer membrane beta-barrel domain-containing protein [Xanthobacter autotrophicus]